MCSSAPYGRQKRPRSAVAAANILQSGKPSLCELDGGESDEAPLEAPGAPGAVEDSRMVSLVTENGLQLFRLLF